MLSIHIPDTTLALTYTAINSIAVLVIFLLMTFSYSNKRANKTYAQGKQPAPSLRSFKTLSKVIFACNMLITLISYWIIMPFSLHNDLLLQSIGVIIVFIGYFNLKRAFTALGNNYSPLFDAYTPLKLSTQGIYSIIRHPIYLFNLFISFGLALSSGSLIVLAGAMIGLFFILRAIHLEENYLRIRFPEYSHYASKTSRLIPFIF